MPKVKAVGLQRRTIGLMNDFFNDIDKLNDNNLSSYQMNLPIRVKKFFDDMNQLGEQEFAEFLKKHQFENRDLAQRQKYNDAFNCLVALIVNEYDESDLLRYFLPKKYSIEAKPTLESNAWRVVHWMKFLSYWLGSKLFNRQKFKMRGAENESLGSAIKAIKQDLSESNYFDLQQNAIFQENLGVVVGKFVENRNKANVERAESDTSSNGDVPLQAGDSDESFREGGFKFGASTSTSELATKSVLSPPPPPPLPAPSNIVKPVSASPGPSSSSVNNTKSPVSNALGNHSEDLLDVIRIGVTLKPVGARILPPPKNNINTNNLQDMFNRALKEKFKNARGDEDEPKEDVNSERLEDWPDQVETVAEKIKVVKEQHNLTDDIKVQHQKTTNTYGRFFSNPPSSKTEEIQPPNENSCTYSQG